MQGPRDYPSRVWASIYEVAEEQDLESLYRILSDVISNLLEDFFKEIKPSVEVAHSIYALATLECDWADYIPFFQKLEHCVTDICPFEITNYERAHSKLRKWSKKKRIVVPIAPPFDLSPKSNFSEHSTDDPVSDLTNPF